MTPRDELDALTSAINDWLREHRLAVLDLIETADAFMATTDDHPIPLHSSQGDPWVDLARAVSRLTEEQP